MKTQHYVSVYLLCHTGLMTLNLVFKHDPLPLAGADCLGNVGLKTTASTISYLMN